MTLQLKNIQIRDKYSFKAEIIIILTEVILTEKLDQFESSNSDVEN